MSPTDAHLPLPLLPSILLLQLTVMTIFFLILLSIEGSFGNAITVSLLPMALTRTFCLSQAMLTGSHEFQSERSGPENDTDLCQCLSLSYCHTGTCTFTLLLAQFIFQTVSLNFCCIASCIASSLSLMQLAFPSGSQQGVGGKRRSRSPFLLFARPCCQIPAARGCPFLGFAPWPRPRSRVLAPFALHKLGCLPGPVCGVREKTASKAVSSLALFFLLLFFLVFAQTRHALHISEPPDQVHLCLSDNGNLEYMSCLCRAHPEKGAYSNLTSAQVCERMLSRREWNLSCQLSSMGPADPSLPVFCYYFIDISLFEFHSSLPILPGVATMDCSNPSSASNFANCTGLVHRPQNSSLRASKCLAFPTTLCEGRREEGSENLSPIEGALCLPFSPSNCVTHCSDSIGGKPVYQPIGFCLQFAFGDSLLHRAYLRLQNGSPLAPFSASNFNTLCRDSVRGLCHHQTYSLSASACLTSCVSHHCEGFILPILHLSSAYGPSQRPFSVTNFAIRGSTCPSSRLSPELEGFCQQFVALSSLCGGSIPPTQVWSSNSSTLGLGGRFPPLHSSNCVSVCTSFLHIGSGAYLRVGTDDSVIKSPLPITCTQSMSSIFAPLPLELLPCYLSIDLTMGSRNSVGLDDSSRSPLPFTCAAPTHGFNFSMPFLDLSVREFCQKSSVLATLLWLLCVLRALVLLAAMLWRNALAMVERRQYTLCQLGLLDLCHSVLLSASLCDSDGSLRATCALLRRDFFAFILGRVIRTQPLPDASMTIGEFQEDAHTWASDIKFEEINSTTPFSSSNPPHSLSDCDFATACTFYTTFYPCFHSSEQADENGLLPPILDTGATHCLLPLRWLTPDQAAFAKRIHLKVASGTSVRALLYNNLIYCKTVSRPLISVGQLNVMLDVRFIWSDSSPLLVACSGGLKYILVESTVIHHLPVISSHEMTVILEALHNVTSTGTLWNAATWSQHLGRKLSPFHWSSPTQHLPPDHAEFTDDPQVTFSSMACDSSLEETPLLPSLQIFPLPSASSSSSSRSFPAASSDALPSSSVITFNLEDHHPPTEDEEMTGKEGSNHSSKVEL